MTIPQNPIADHLKKHMERLALQCIDRQFMPAELEGIDRDRLIDLLAEQATPILRKIEDDAIDAAIRQVCSMIRFAKQQEKK